MKDIRDAVETALSDKVTIPKRLRTGGALVAFRSPELCDLVAAVPQLPPQDLFRQQYGTVAHDAPILTINGTTRSRRFPG